LIKWTLWDRFVVKRSRRRNWIDDEKRMICAQTRVRGVSVSQVARRYDVNANQVFNWLKEPRFADAEPPEAGTAFLPVEITEPRDIPVPSDSTEPGTLEINLCNGHRLLITGAYDADALARLIRGLSS
jgi:transposase